MWAAAAGAGPGAPTALATTGSWLREQRIGAAAKGPRRLGGARGAGRAAASGAGPLPIPSSQQHRCGPALFLGRPLPTWPTTTHTPTPLSLQHRVALRGPRATAVQRSCALTSCAGFCPSIHISPRHLWGAKYVRGPAELGEEVAQEGSKQPRNSQFISLGL